MAETTRASGEMRRSLTLTGVTVNAMALIAPGAFLWTTFQIQSQSQAGQSTAYDMWPALLFSLILALLTAYSYSELARIYPDAGTGSSYYFAEAALLDKESPGHRKWARFSKLSVGWISHLYYWIYPGIMVAFTATLFGYIYLTVAHHQLTYTPLMIVAVVFAFLVGYIAYRGITGSTISAIVVNVIQIISLLAVSIIFISYRLGHASPPKGFSATDAGGAWYEHINAGHVIVPHNFIHLIFQSTIAILLLVGFESITALGAEAINPGKDIRRGILLSLLIQGGICYLFEYFAANFAIGAATISTAAVPAQGSTAAVAGTAGYGAAGNDSAPIGTMIHNIAEKSLGHTGTTVSLIVAFTVMLALIGTTLACLNTGVRVTYAMAKDREMPSVLGLLHGKYASPHGGVWTLVVVSALLGMYGVQPKQTDNLTQITTASNLGTFLVYGFTCVIAIVAFSHRHDKHWLKHYAVPGLGAAMNLFELGGVVYLAFKAGGTLGHDAIISIDIVLLWIIVGAAWVALNPKTKGRKIVDVTAPKRDAAAAAPISV